MKLASIALFSAVSLTACSKRPPSYACELVYRAPAHTNIDPEFNSSVTRKLLERLNALSGHPELAVTTTDGSVVVQLGREPDADQLASIRRRIESRGTLQFLISADSRTPNLDGLEERRRLDAWRAAHHGEDLDQFNRVARGSGGPSSSIEWHVRLGMPGDPAGIDPAPMACERPTAQASTFTTADLGDITYEVEPEDASVVMSLLFEVVDRRQADLTAFRTGCVGRELAIVYNGEVIAAERPSVPLTQPMDIGCYYTARYCDDMLAILRSGELPLALEFVELRKLR